MKRWWWLLLLVLLYACTGIFQVMPGEWAVVRRCGQPLAEPRGPGLHWGMPWGIDQVDRVAVDEQRQLTVGYFDETGPGDSLAPLNQAAPTGQLLTGDNQILNLRVNVLYRVNRDKLVDYVTMRPGLEELLQRSTEEAMTESVASQRIDQILTGRAAILESMILDRLRQRSAEYRTGLVIDSVNIATAQPPQELIEIFRDVNRARSQRDVVITDANARRNADVSEARRDAEKQSVQGKAYAVARYSQAQSEAGAFRALLATFPTTEPAASAGLLQLYLNEMQPILSRMQVRTLSDQGVEQVVIMPSPSK